MQAVKAAKPFRPFHQDDDNVITINQRPDWREEITPGRLTAIFVAISLVLSFLYSTSVSGNWTTLLKFLNQTPYNRAFAETMTFVKDFWNIPEFGQLLEPTQRYLSGYVVAGQFDDAQTALDGLAEEQDAVLVEAGYLE